MCMVSNIGDQWGRDFPDRYPWVKPVPLPHIEPPFPMPVFPAFPDKQPDVSREEFDKLRKEMEALRELLKAAKKFDESTGQPHCEVDAKVRLIKEIAKLVGVELGDVFEQPDSE